MKTKTRTTAKSTSKAKASKGSSSSRAKGSIGKSRAASQKSVRASTKPSKSATKSKTLAKSKETTKTRVTPRRSSTKSSNQSVSVKGPSSAAKSATASKGGRTVTKSVGKTTSRRAGKVTSARNRTPIQKTAKVRSGQGEVKTKSGTTLKAVDGGIKKDSKTAIKAAKKISVAEKLSASHLVKRQSKPKSNNAKRSLKLVKKGPIKVPATKISRSDSYASDSKVIMGNFSFGEDESRPVVAPKRPVAREEVCEERASVLFESGDKIVYPGHGVGEIEGIRSTVLDGQEHHIYNITILESGMKVMVPVSQAATVGLRKIIDKQAIDEVFSILRDRDFKIDTQTWNRRFREYSQKIKTGSVFEIAIVLRDLSVLSVDKELSFGEKKMLDMAESLLVSEIALARSRSHEKVAGELRALFTT